jgi:hypothetical protein
MHNMFAKVTIVGGLSLALALGSVACGSKKVGDSLALEDPTPAEETRPEDTGTKPDSKTAKTDAKSDDDKPLSAAERQAAKRAGTRPGAKAPSRVGAKTPAPKPLKTATVKNLDAVKSPPAIGDLIAKRNPALGAKVPTAAVKPAAATPPAAGDKAGTPPKPAPNTKLAGTVPPTAADPATKRPTPKPKLAVPAPRVSTFPLERYLGISKVRTLTGNRALRPSGPIDGITPNPTYNSVVYEAASGKGYGVSLQVWRDGSRQDSQRRFTRMLRQYPNAEATKALTPSDAFFSYWGNVQTLTIVNDKKRSVASVSCGETLCTQKALFELAKHVQSKL